MTDLRLITIALSHFCEKARWALDRAGLEYVEEAHPPLLHGWATWRAGGGDTTPVLVTPDGTFGDSTDILRWVETKAKLGLYAAPDAAELEDLCDEELGPHTRRWVYSHVLRDARLTRRALTTGARAGARLAYRALQPVITLGMWKGLNITPESVVRSRAKVDMVFGKVDALLAQGRRYLGGDRLGAADIAFAALGAPMVGPEGYGPLGMDLPPIGDLPAAFHEEAKPFRDRPAGQLILRLYREERRARAGVGASGY